MRLADLQPASFRGAGFLVPSDSVEEGRNSILHEYPDASHRYVEDNGLITPQFAFPAVLSGPGLPAKFSRLRRALNTPGPGVLRHPYYGSVLCAVVGPYTVLREDADSGVITIEVKFAATGGPVFPGLVSGLPAVVRGLAASVAGRAGALLATLWRRPRTEATRLRLTGAVRRAGDTLDRNFRSSSPAIRRLANEADALALDPQRLSADLTAAARDPFEDLGLSAAALVRGFADLRDTAADLRLEAAAIAPATLDLLERGTLIGDLAATLDLLAFAGLAEAMAGRRYETADQVDADEALLSQAVAVTSVRVADNDGAIEVSRLFLETSAVLQEQEVRLPRLAELAVTAFPASVLAYHLYDAPDRASGLVDLNPLRSPLLFDGVVTVMERTP